MIEFLIIGNSNTKSQWQCIVYKTIRSMEVIFCQIFQLYYDELKTNLETFPT